MASKNLASLALFLASGYVGMSAYSAEAAEDSSTDTIVVTASRFERTLANATHSVEVIDKESIAARQAASVTDLLRQIVGLNVIQQGARGSVTSVVLRGGEPNFTVVLIDGVKVNDSLNTRGGSYDFSFLDMSNIERVEIVRGPMSAVYGSDALSGVINIITARQEPESVVNAQVGGHGLAAGSLSLGGMLGEIATQIGVHGTNEDGDIEGASYSDKGADGSFKLPLGGNNAVGLNWRYQDAKSTSFPEDSGGPRLAILREPDRRAVSETHGRVYGQFERGNAWSTSLALSHYQREESSQSVGIAPGVFDGVPPVVSDSRFVRDQLTVSMMRDISNDASLLVGGELQREDGRSTGTIDFGFLIPTNYELDRNTVSAFAEFEWQFDRIQLQTSLRWDDPDRIGSESSAQIGVMYTLPDNGGSIRMNWGQGFKAPSFFALGHPLVGNPALEAETSTSLDVGYRANIGKYSCLDISAYRNVFENLIDFDPNLFTNVNRKEVVTKGGEIAWRWGVSDAVKVDAHLTYLDTDIRDSDSELRGRPNWRGGFTGSWQIDDKWQVSASWLSLADFYDSSIPTGSVVVDGYERLDAAAAYQVTKTLRLGFAIDNLLDEEYFEAVGFPAAGMRARVNAAYSFN